MSGLRLLVPLPPPIPCPSIQHSPLLLPQWFPACLSCKAGGAENIPKNACPHAKQRAPPAPRALLTNARDTLHRNLPHTFLEAAEPGVDLSDLGLFALNQLLDDLRKEGSEEPTPEPATTLPGQSEAPPLIPGVSPPHFPKRQSKNQNHDPASCKHMHGHVVPMLIPHTCSPPHAHSTKSTLPPSAS